tara:strand:- start:1294 stop:1839 length:546 start_codon:yes stop_codon:yes gene_type:complete
MDSITTYTVPSMSEELKAKLVRSCKEIKHRGKILKARKIVEYNNLGKSYYYPDGFGGEIPEDLYDYLRAGGLGEPWINEKSSVLINLYDEKGSISYHTDSIKELEEGSQISSYSFALDSSIRYKIGTMMIKENEIIEKIDIYPNHLFVWDAYEHNKRNIKHSTRQGKKAGERLNITIRTLK